MDISVAGVGLHGLCAEGDDPVVLLHAVDGLREVAHEAVEAEDGMVGRRHNDGSLGVHLCDDGGGIGDAGGGVAAQGLAEDLPR